MSVHCMLRIVLDASDQSERETILILKETTVQPAGQPLGQALC